MNEVLIVYSALEQFGDSPVLETNITVLKNESFPVEHEFFAYKDLLNHFLNGRERYSMPIFTNTRLMETTRYHECAILYLKTIVDVMVNNQLGLDLSKARLPAHMDAPFINPTRPGTVVHYACEFREIVNDLLLASVAKYHYYDMEAAERLAHRIQTTKPSFRVVLNYLFAGLNWSPFSSFYDLVVTDFTERLELFHLGYVLANGWCFESEKELIQAYKSAAIPSKLTHPYDVPFGISMSFGLEKAYNDRLFNYISFGLAPKGEDVKSDEKLIEYFYLNSLLWIELKLKLHYEMLYEVVSDYLKHHRVDDRKKYLDPWEFDGRWVHEGPYMDLVYPLIHTRKIESMLGMNTRMTPEEREKEELKLSIQFMQELFKDGLAAEAARENAEESSKCGVIFFTMGRLYFFTLLSAGVFVLLYLVCCFKAYVLLPSVYQYFFESLYSFILKIVSEQAGMCAVVHFPLVFSLFNVILYGNLIGLIPSGFTVTSHITFTFSMGLSVFIGIMLLTLLNKKISMVWLFVPRGVPVILVPLLCVIEVVSYIFRVVSLSVRLFANMMAGHALLHILLGFVPVIFSMKNVLRFLFVFPIVVIVMITILELGISLLQSYVFVVLVSIYMRDCYGQAEH